MCPPYPTCPAPRPSCGPGGARPCARAAALLRTALSLPVRKPNGTQLGWNRALAPSAGAPASAVGALSGDFVQHRSPPQPRCITAGSQVERVRSCSERRGGVLTLYMHLRRAVARLSRKLCHCQLNLCLPVHSSWSRTQSELDA
jgi:hypothetical protein